MTSHCIQPANWLGSLASTSHGLGLLSMKLSYRNLGTGVSPF